MNEQTADVLSTDATFTVAYTPREGIEEWRHVVGYEGLYEVSNLGRVREIDTMRILPLIRDYVRGKEGYLCVRLFRRDMSGYRTHSSVSVHVLVAKAFIPNPDKGYRILHKDGDKDNNCIILSNSLTTLS